MIDLGRCVPDYNLEDLDFEELVTLMGKRIAEIELHSLIWSYLGITAASEIRGITAASEIRGITAASEIITAASEIIDILLKTRIISKVIDEMDIISFSECVRNFSVAGRGKYSYVVNIDVNKFTNLRFQDGTLTYEYQ